MSEYSSERRDDVPEELGQLLGVCTRQEAAELKTLYNAQIQCLKAYQQDPTAQRKRDWDAAREGYEERLSGLWRHYMEPAESEEERIFKNRLEALEYLQRRGYKIGKSKLYKDVRNGLLKIQANGNVYKSDLDNYVKKAGLSQLDLDQAAEETDELNKQKLQKEVEKLDWENKRRQFEYEKELGRYIPRSDFEAEMAARVAAHEARLRNMIRERAMEWIWTVNGDPQRAQDLMEQMGQDLNDLFNELARMDQFQVVFVSDEEPAGGSNLSEEGE